MPKLSLTNIDNNFTFPLFNLTFYNFKQLNQFYVKKSIKIKAALLAIITHFIRLLRLMW